MKRFYSLFAVMALSALVSCVGTDVRRWSEKKIKAWYETSEWQNLPIKPDRSVDVREFVEQNVLSPEEWKAAYDFMSDTDFGEILPGRYELTESGVYATVTDYMTKDTALFEAHRKYIDIQYVAAGREYIAIGDVNEKVPVSAFDEEKDIEFFTLDESHDFLADSSVFFVLFPKDAHRPCIKVENNSPVRKIVVKIPYVE